MAKLQLRKLLSNKDMHRVLLMQGLIAQNPFCAIRAYCTNCFVQIQLIAQNLFCSISLPIAQNPLPFVLKWTIPKVNSSWHAFKNNTLLRIYCSTPDPTCQIYIELVLCIYQRCKRRKFTHDSEKRKRKREGFCSISCYCTKQVLCNNHSLKIIKQVS